MSDEMQDRGVHEECGHAVEAHSNANGCELCECSESLGRDFGVPDGEVVVVEAPTIEAGADGV